MTRGKLGKQEGPELGQELGEEKRQESQGLSGHDRGCVGFTRVHRAESVEERGQEVLAGSLSPKPGMGRGPCREQPPSLPPGCPPSAPAPGWLF